MVQSLDGQWRLAPDPKNVGRAQQWWQEVQTDSQPAPVPGTIQQVCPGYHGVAWYWRTFLPQGEGDPTRRWLLRFGAVDYLAEVWLNGQPVGGHEGGETPFSLDVTGAVRPGQENLLCVRVLNPTHERIDGIALRETPHRNREIPFRAGASFDQGGIMQGVELGLVPAVRIADLFAWPQIKGELIRLQVTVHNDRQEPARVRLVAEAALAAGGGTVGRAEQEATCPPGETVRHLECPVPSPHLWSLEEPHLYRAAVRLEAEGDSYRHDQAVRCGFREFCFRDGYFRLNGRRVFLRSSHTGNHYPIGMQMAVDPELLRRDLYFAKAAGFNMIRFIAGLAFPEQLDFCDELGLMVYEESLAGWCLEDSPQMGERFDRSVAEMVRRDRNHPSLVIWGLLNETPEGPVFRQAVAALPLVRALDKSRLVMLNSGRWDGQLGIGSLSNPGSAAWETLLGEERPGGPAVKMAGPGGYCPGMGDVHAYPRAPHLPETIEFLRTIGQGSKHVFLSEYGIGSQVNPRREMLLFEQAGARRDLEDYLVFQEWSERLRADWERLGLDGIFACPQELFEASWRLHSEQRLLGLNAIRANPHLCGYSLTGTVDQGMTGEGLWTTWRELKPGVMEALREGWAPLRWCLFVEPRHIYRGGTVTVEAVLANEDVLLPGQYPVCWKVVAPDGEVLHRHTLKLQVPAEPEPPLALPVLAQELRVDHPAGRYQVVVEFERGAAPAGGRACCYVTDAIQLPALEGVVTVWGEDARVAQWLRAREVVSRPFLAQAPKLRELILVCGEGAPSDDPAPWEELVRRIAQGGTAIFLTPRVLGRSGQELGWLPLGQKGEAPAITGWVYHRDDFARRHPIFEGLPSGGLLDWDYYREIIPDHLFVGQERASEVVAGGLTVGYTCPGGYAAGSLVATYELGEGRFVINALLLAENLGHPVADRLLANMIRYGAVGAWRPLAPLPADWPRLLGRIGCR